MPTPTDTKTKTFTKAFVTVAFLAAAGSVIASGFIFTSINTQRPNIPGILPGHMASYIPGYTPGYMAGYIPRAPGYLPTTTGYVPGYLK